jgi:hypothetical protein
MQSRVSKPDYFWHVGSIIINSFLIIFYLSIFGRQGFTVLDKPCLATGYHLNLFIDRALPLFLRD